MVGRRSNAGPFFQDMADEIAQDSQGTKQWQNVKGTANNETAAKQ